VESLQLSIHSLLNMEEYKSKLNFQKENGYGQLFGYFPDINNMVHGLQVVKLI
jgi:hypothetical protein